MKKKNLFLILSVVMVTLIGGYAYVGWLKKQNSDTQSKNNGQIAQQSEQNTIDYYTCAMHPSVKQLEPGHCPICGMDLIPAYKTTSAVEGALSPTFFVSPAKQQLIGVKTTQVEYRNVEKIIHAVGRVGYDERRLAVVNLRVSGWIQELFVDYTGKFVPKGQILFTLYSPELVSAQEEYLLAKSASNSYTSSQMPLTDENNLLETARRRLRLWEITDEQITQLEKRGIPEINLPIVSPLSGFVIEKNALKGMRIDPGMTLYKIADLSSVWVYADVYEYELPYVKLGQEASVTISGSTNSALKGRITYILPFLDPATRTTRVRIELPNSHGILKPEMFADVEINVPLGKRITVPQDAVLQTGKRNIVFVDRGNGMFEPRFVDLGVRSEYFNEILRGVKPGELVVSSSNFLIDAESKIQGVLQRMEHGMTEASKDESPALRHQH